MSIPMPYCQSATRWAGSGRYAVSLWPMSSMKTGGGSLAAIYSDPKRPLQHLAGLGDDAHLAYRVRHRITAALGLARGQEADAVGKNVGALRHRQLLHHSERRVGLEAGDNPALRGVEPSPPGIIVIAEIKDIGGARLDRHLLGRGDVVDVGRAHRGVDRTIGVGVIDDVHLGA